MPVTFRTEPSLSYPVLMVNRAGTVKLFIDETDGIVLRKPGGTESLADNISHLAMDGQMKELGDPVPATDPFWTRFSGSITLGND